MASKVRITYKLAHLTPGANNFELYKYASIKQVDKSIKKNEISFLPDRSGYFLPEMFISFFSSSFKKFTRHSKTTSTHPKPTLSETTLE